ncbi:hypothetical protein APHAL10511_004569 [Amanita phalloides]|nr:hypothetical protein APHAL10511_004569 [Amanita phalloides]
MTVDATQEIILAVAFIIESSLPVYQQWGLVLRDYLTFILRRLADAYSGARMRIGFVTYGPADMAQSPLLCKRFFVDHQLVFKEMKDSPVKLGFGLANIGGDKGMAALDGHVAALELFDIMHETSQKRKGRIASNFVIHVAAFPPDASRYPRWNESASLDRTTWDSLPSEYQKRNIIYNAIILNGRIHQFIGLHATMQQLRAESKPWFSVRAPHMVLLSGIPTLEEPKPTSVKRSGDVEKTPESKRPRLSQNKPERPPRQEQGEVTSTQQGHVESSQRTSTSTTTPQHAFMVQLRSRVLALEDGIRGLETKISEAQMAGNKQMADTLSLEWKKQKDFLTNLQRRIYELIQSSNLMQSGGGSANNKPTTPDPPRALQDTSSALRKNENANLFYPQSGDPYASNPQSSDGMNGLQFASSMEGIVTEAPIVTYKAQVQPTVDQDRRTRPMQGGAGQMVQSQNAMSSQLRLPQVPVNVQRIQPSNALVVWHGQLIWNGLGPMGKKECRAKVVALSQNTAECRADTWPPVMTLMPMPEPTVSLVELKEWINRLKPVICRFQPDPTDPTNEQYYKSLIQMLTAKRIFAVAGWTLPSGAQENNVLVFPVNNQALLGAFFPVTGIPELPKPQAMASLNAQVLAQFQRLPPERRDYEINRYLQRSNFQTGGIHAAQAHASTDRLNFNSFGIHSGGGSTLTSLQHTGMLQQQASFIGGLDEITASQAMSSLPSDSQLG